MKCEQSYKNQSLQTSQPNRVNANGLVATYQLRTRRSISGVLALGVIGLLAGNLSVASTPTVDEVAHAQWRDTMINMETPQVGCFQAKFPSTLWESISCGTLTVHAHPVPHIRGSGQTLTIGNGTDYALQATGLITKTVGSFPSVSGVVEESTVGVPALGDGGILGANEYTLQINTNNDAKTSACSGGAADCTVWQQFVYATDYETKGSAVVFMQYWLLNYGSSCPSGYTYSATNNCYKNSSSYVTAPDVAITSLGSLKMTGTVVPGGNDTATFTDGTVAYSVSIADSVLQIGTVWRDSEFNVLGDVDSSKAVFNQDSAITVNVAVLDGSTTAPACLSAAGTTAETNNLTLGSCAAVGGATPSIQFTEAWSGTTDSPTMTEGTYTHYALGYGVTTAKGFDAGLIGSMSPTKTSDGLTYTTVDDFQGPYIAEGDVILSGFTSDPGQGWLGSVTAVGVTKTAATATYSYSSGQATWTWSEFGFTGSGTATVQITHQ